VNKTVVPLINTNILNSLGGGHNHQQNHEVIPKIEKIIRSNH